MTRIQRELPTHSEGVLTSELSPILTHRFAVPTVRELAPMPEAERARLRHGVRDGVSGILAGLILAVAEAQDGVAPPVRELLIGIERGLMEVFGDIRDVLEDRPTTVEA